MYAGLMTSYSVVNVPELVSLKDKATYVMAFPSVESLGKDADDAANNADALLKFNMNIIMLDRPELSTFDI